MKLSAHEHPHIILFGVNDADYSNSVPHRLVENHVVVEPVGDPEPQSSESLVW